MPRVEVRATPTALERAEAAAERRAFQAGLEQLLHREIRSAVSLEVGELRTEIAALRSELLEKVGGQIRLERIETTRVIGSDLEALQQEVRQLKAVREATLADAGVLDREPGRLDRLGRTDHHPARPGPAAAARPARLPGVPRTGGERSGIRGTGPRGRVEPAVEPTAPIPPVLEEPEAAPPPTVRSRCCRRPRRPSGQRRRRSPGRRAALARGPVRRAAEDPAVHRVRARPDRGTGRAGAAREPAAATNGSGQAPPVVRHATPDEPAAPHRASGPGTPRRHRRADESNAGQELLAKLLAREGSLVPSRQSRRASRRGCAPTAGRCVDAGRCRR